MADKSWDYLNKLSKPQIIQFLKQNCFFQAPDQDKVDWFYWELTSKELLNKMDENLIVSRKICNEIGDLEDSLKANMSNSDKSKIYSKLLILRSNYDKNHTEYKNLDNKLQKVNKLVR